MDAWIDCISDLYEDNNILVLHIENIKILKEKNIEIYEKLIECSSFVNYRFVEKSDEQVLSLSFY